MLNHPAEGILGLDEYVYDPDTPPGHLLWTAECSASWLDVRVEAGNRLSIRNPREAGLFELRLTVDDGSSRRSRNVRVKVSSFLIDPFHQLPPLVLDRRGWHVSDYSLHGRVIPPDFPRDRIEWRVLQPYPPGVGLAAVGADGRVRVRVDEPVAGPPVLLKFLARLKDPAKPPTPSPLLGPVREPTRKPPRKPSATPAPTPASMPSPTVTPTAMPAFTPTAIPSPIPSPDGPRLVLDVCGREYAFRLAYARNTGPGPLGLETADMNRDGRVDFVTANYGADTATVFLSNPAGGHGRIDLTGGEGTQSALVADWPGGGLAGLALLGAIDSDVTLFRQPRPGRFIEMGRRAAGVVPLPGDRPASSRLRLMAVGRFEAPDTVNLAVAGLERLHIFTVDETGFLDEWRTPLPAPIAQLAAADLDGNGVDELIAANADPPGMAAHSVQGRTLRTLWELPFDETIEGNTPLDTLASGLDGDGFADAASLTFDGHLYIAYGGPSAWRAETLALDQSLLVTGLSAADMDGDGIKEFLAAGLDLDREAPVLSVLCRDGAGGLFRVNAAALPAGFSLRQRILLSTIDWNLDTLPDIALTDRDGQRLLVYENQGAR